MPATKKRPAEDEHAGPTTRASKAAKTEGGPKAKPASKGHHGKKATSSFLAHALPLHVNITHTPPSVPPEGEQGTEKSADPGFIGTTTLLPSTFSTGSYGWKGGNKRITVELLDNESGKTEKVSVMLTINAVVMGSKNAPEGEGGEDKDAEGEEDKKMEEVEEHGEVEAVKAAEEAPAAEEEKTADDKAEATAEPAEA
ncbi:hypothetical protein C8Q75DRAFT_731380 [Abortiporus biennis]|nr:hypothetical protein C8Q75DRAFT_731380 [Abortiporus biennis]